MIRILYTLLLISSFSLTQLHAQEESTEPVGVLLFTVNMGFQQPAGDLSDRFGNSLAVGSDLEWISKRNMIYGLHGNLLFGNKVKEDVLANLRTPEGEIIGNTRSYADVQLRQRGLYVGGYIGKLFSISKKNPRSAIRVTIGGGILQHKIRIQDDPESFVTQLDKQYKKGYDRLSNGFSLNEFVGYQYLSPNRLINFYVGFEFYQGFTQNRRDFNYDTRSRDEKKRLDILTGIKLGWSLPFYLGEDEKEIYY